MDSPTILNLQRTTATKIPGDTNVVRYPILCPNGVYIEPFQQATSEVDNFLNGTKVVTDEVFTDKQVQGSFNGIAHPSAIVPLLAALLGDFTSSGAGAAKKWRNTSWSTPWDFVVEDRWKTGAAGAFQYYYLKLTQLVLTLPRKDKLLQVSGNFIGSRDVYQVAQPSLTYGDDADYLRGSWEDDDSKFVCKFTPDGGSEQDMTSYIDNWTCTIARASTPGKGTFATQPGMPTSDPLVSFECSHNFNFGLADPDNMEELWMAILGGDPTGAAVPAGGMGNPPSGTYELMITGGETAELTKYFYLAINGTAQLKKGAFTQKGSFAPVITKFKTAPTVDVQNETANYDKPTHS